MAIIWTRESIQQLLLSNDKALVRGLIQIYHRQTFSERSAADATVQNGEGFTVGDARKLTKFAETCLNLRPLTEAEMRELRNRMLKYAGQLLRVIAKNQVETHLQQLKGTSNDTSKTAQVAKGHRAPAVPGTGSGRAAQLYQNAASGHAGKGRPGRK